MNKSELELQNLTRIIAQMPADENRMCVTMVQSLFASLGDPLTGPTFMIAVAYANVQCAVSAIAMGLVNPDGEQGDATETFEQLAKMGQNAKLHGKMAMGGMVSPTTAKRVGQMQIPKSPFHNAAKAAIDKVTEAVSVGKMWPQHGMTRERYVELMEPNSKEKLTREELSSGWFFDDKFGDLLANHAWKSHE